MIAATVGESFNDDGEGLARLEDDPSGLTAEKQMGRKTSRTKTHEWYQNDFVFRTTL